MLHDALHKFQTIAFTHKTIPLEIVGKFHLEADKQGTELRQLKAELGVDELMYLSTCNRVEFFTVGEQRVAPEVLIQSFVKNLSKEEIDLAVRQSECFEGLEAVRHLFRVSSSLDSMVIGEREIITQVRKAYEQGEELGLTGDFLRLIMQKTVQTAKRVFTETGIFRKPVSVVSLAFHRLKELNVPSDGRVVMVGAGKTNRAMARFLSKHGFKDITIYNRTIERAEALAGEIGGIARPLSELGEHDKGFDVLIACTGAEHAVVDKRTFTRLLNGEDDRKVIIDLAIPADVDPSVFAGEGIHHHHINIEELRAKAERNLRERSREIHKCEEIVDLGLEEFEMLYQERRVELAMRDIPGKIKEIRNRAVNNVYAKEIESLNPESREVLEKVVSYLEKKYISVPMKMAREVMLNKSK